MNDSFLCVQFMQFEHAQESWQIHKAHYNI